MNEMTPSEEATAPRAMTAAEKRAARRARVLAGGERRLQLLTGEIASLKPATGAQEPENLDAALEAGVQELLDGSEAIAAAADKQAPEGDAVGSEAVAASAVAVTSNEKAEERGATGAIRFPPRVDPAQRRRDAAARRQKKEAMVEEILSGGSGPSVATSSAKSADPASAEGVYAEAVDVVRKELSTPPSTTTATVEPAYSRHTIALRLQSAEEKIILLVIFATAVYLAFAADLRGITTDVLKGDPLFQSYQQLFAQGVPMQSIRQQMQRENVDPTLQAQLERLFASQRLADHGATSGGFFSNLLDLPAFFSSLLLHPPMILFVFAVRVVVGLVGAGIHQVLQLPEVKNPQDDDLGFVANLALSSRPVLKAYLIKMRKSIDDLFFFLWVFILVVAGRTLLPPTHAPTV